MAKNYSLSKAGERMKEKGTVGLFTRASKRAHEGIGEHARKVLSSKTASGTQKKEANFARMSRRGWKPLPK